MPSVIAIIPARLASRRFSRKVLYRINGKPLIFYAWQAACRARLVERVYVATDSEEIGRAVNGFGGTVILTSPRPRNGSERAAEAIRGIKADIIINIQADNVGLPGTMLDRIVRAMKADQTIAFATLARPIIGKRGKEKVRNPDVVKVVPTADGHAGWFSRQAIPYVRDSRRSGRGEKIIYWEHIGVYFFRRKALIEYAGWPPTTAEKAESLEQLRILENGGRIRLFLTRADVVSVDSRKTAEKLQRRLL